MTVKKKMVATGFVVLALCMVATMLWVGFKLMETKAGLAMESNATVGMLPGIDPEQRRAELQSLLDDSMIAFSVNTKPVFSAKTGKGNLMVENPGNNAKLLTAELVLRQGEQIIYQSDAIKPGTYLESVQLTTVPAPGVYDAVVYLKAYREDTQEYIGQTGAQVTLTIDPS